MKIKAYYEVLGKDKESVLNLLKKIEESLKNDKELKIIESKIDEPIEREIEDQNKNKFKVFSSYLEVKLEFENLEKLFNYISIYTPSEITFEDLKEVKFVLRDKEIKLNDLEFNNLMNILTSRILELTRIVNDLSITNKILLENLKKYAPRVYDQLQKTHP